MQTRVKDGSYEGGQGQASAGGKQRAGQATDGGLGVEGWRTAIAAAPLAGALGRVAAHDVIPGVPSGSAGDGSSSGSISHRVDR